MKIPKELKPENVTAIIDTREQNPFALSPLKTTVRGLDTGDYSVLGLESLIAVERKSLDDLLMCCGQERERFEREIQRLLGYPTRAIVVEGTLSQIERGDYRSKIHPSSVIGSVISWQRKGINIMFCENREMADKHTAKFLFSEARARYRESLPFLESVLNTPEP